MSFDLGDYNDVAARITEFRAKHPEGSLRPVDPDVPYRIEVIAEQCYISVVAAAYRSPEDSAPGVGMAYEPVPGRTQYTRGSELQNAETSAWGRAIVAALAADTRKGVASSEEVRNRVAEREIDAQADAIRTEIRALAAKQSWPPRDVMGEFHRRTNRNFGEAPAEMLNGFLASLRIDGLPATEEATCS